MKQKITKIVCICTALIIMLIQYPVMAADLGDRGVDIVIIIDSSGSMKQTDPDQIAIEAAKLFIDMIEMSGSRVALIPFSDELGTIIELTEIHNEEDKERIKDVINQLKYTGDTDIGMALQKGYEILNKSSDIGNHQAILFFTDGRIDLGSKRIRTDADSLKDAKEAVSFAANARIPIYSIGLNADGNVDKKLLQDMATNTKGSSYIVDSADNLPMIFNEIFAEFINSNILELGAFETNGTDFTTIPFNIPNNSVLEANIIMLSNNQLQEIELTDPNGNVVNTDSTKVIMSQSKQYNMLKLIEPQTGDWTLRIKGEKGCKVHVNLIFNYKVSLECKAEVITQGGNTILAVTSWLEKEGTQLADDALYEAFTGQAFLESTQGESAYPMQAAGHSFYVEIPISDTEEYQVYTRVDSDSMYRISDTIIINPSAVPTIAPIINEPVFDVNIPEIIELNGFFGFLLKERINLVDYVTKADQEEISFSIISPDSSIAKASLNNNNVLSISAVKSGETTMMVTVNNSNGEIIQKEIIIIVKCTVTSIIHIIAAVIILIFIIISLVKLRKWHKNATRIFYGKIKWQIVSTTGIGAGRECIYDMSYEKGMVPLSKFISDPAITALNLKKITMKMNNSNDCLIITCRDKKISMSEGFGISSKNSITLSNGSFTIIAMKNEGIDVSLKITYITF